MAQQVHGLTMVVEKRIEGDDISRNSPNLGPVANTSVVKEKSQNTMNWRQALPPKQMASQQPRQRLEYLDGLRGFAALLVYLLHYEGYTHEPGKQAIIEGGWGVNREYAFVAFPIVRLLFSGGHFAVAIFFVISGYVLSSSPLRSIQNRDTIKLADTISSALFRRWFRLYIPVAATTFLWMASWHLLGVKSVHKTEKNFRDEVWKWYCEFKNFSFIFTDNHFNTYNFHVWSIPMEFRGSIVVYTLAIALRRASHSRRLLCEATLAFYFIYVADGWYCALFVIGMLLCDLDLLAETQRLPRALGRFRNPNRWLFVLLIFCGLYLGGVPSLDEDIQYLRHSPGWYWLSFLKPQAMWDFRWFYRIFGAAFVVAAIPHLPLVRTFFESTFCQYLGKVSYGFYLIHGPVLWSLGDRLYAASGRILPHHIETSPRWINYMPLPDSGPLGLELNHFAPQLILLPFTLWLADAATRLFDDPSVKFTQWLYRSILEQVDVSRKLQNEQLV